MSDHHPRTSTMSNSTWSQIPSLVSSFDITGRASPSKSLYRSSRSNTGAAVISKPNTPSPTHSPGPGSPLYHHHPSHNNLNYMQAIQQHTSQYKASTSR